jgi:hypothetical protein
MQMPVWVAPAFQEAWTNQVLNLLPLLRNPDLPILLIDNVADFYYHGSDQEFWDLRRDFPNLAPPFPAFWCEHRMATEIYSKEKGTTNLASKLGTNGKIGALIHSIDPAKARGEGQLPPGTHWILWAELFIDYGRQGDFPTGPHGSVFFYLDADGALLDRPWMQGFARDEDAEQMRSLMTFFYPSLLAISFLHCKNVQIIENEVPKPLAKRYRERHGVTPCRYKTLVIEPLKQILRHEGGSHTVGLAKALHICRGHFRDYRQGRGLFGKYHQLVWTPSIVRGTKGSTPPAREIQVKL